MPFRKVKKTELYYFHALLDDDTVKHEQSLNAPAHRRITAMDQNQEEWLFASFEKLDTKHHQLGYVKADLPKEEKYDDHVPSQSVIKDTNTTITQSQSSYNANNNKQPSHPENPSSSNMMTWEMISQCTSHEMYPKIANTIRSIIDNYQQHQIGLNDFNDVTITKMIEILKDKQLPIEEQNYFYNLCQRAKQFVPINTHNRQS